MLILCPGATMVPAVPEEGPMRLLVIDPVVREAATRDEAYVREVAAPGTTLVVESLSTGPQSIETYYDEAHAAPEILALVRRYSSQVDAFVINCFADPALDAARETTDKPVIGAGESAMLLALQLGHRFSVVSVLPNTAAWVQRQVTRLGVQERFASAAGVGIPVLSLSGDPGVTVEEITRLADTAVRHDGAEVIVLGCTGMATMAERVREGVSVPVVEPTSAAVKIAELMVSLDLSHHRGGIYLQPSFDKIVGYHAADQGVPGGD